MDDDSTNVEQQPRDLTQLKAAWNKISAELAECERSGDRSGQPDLRRALADVWLEAARRAELDDEAAGGDGMPIFSIACYLAAQADQEAAASDQPGAQIIQFHASPGIARAPERVHAASGL
jgi:hypothetical protein